MKEFYYFCAISMLIAFSSCSNRVDLLEENSQNETLSFHASYGWDETFPIAEINSTGSIDQLATETEITEIFQKFSSYSINEHYFHEYTDGNYLVGQSNHSKVYVKLIPIANSNRMYANGTALECEGEACGDCAKDEVEMICNCSPGSIGQGPCDSRVFSPI